MHQIETWPLAGHPLPKSEKAMDIATCETEERRPKINGKSLFANQGGGAGGSQRVLKNFLV